MLPFSKSSEETSLDYGRASEPGLSFVPATPNQQLRTLLTIASAGQLAAQLGDVPARMKGSLQAAMHSPVPFARSLGAQAMLAFEFNRGRSAEVVPAIALLERAMNTMHCLPDRQRSREPQADIQPPAGSKLSNARFMALFTAGALCSDEPGKSVVRLENAGGSCLGRRGGCREEPEEDVVGAVNVAG